MPYVNPTLFGLAYAARLFRQFDYDLNFDNFRGAASPVDLTNPDHARLLRDWLNSWGCRIDKTKLHTFSNGVANWSRQWLAQLPSRSLLNLSDPDVELLADSFDDLRNKVMGPTAASKTIFFLLPETAVPWDDAIRNGLHVGQSRAGYIAMLKQSQEELAYLVANAGELHVSESRIPEVVGSPARTLVRLLDEYHWITITRGHEIPTCAELRQWVSWASEETGKVAA